jgi:HAD superfamily hydrolase (TIGR01458 family)
MPIAGLLLDLEGVLHQGDVPIPGVADALRQLAAGGIGLRYLTNTTTMPRRTIAARLAEMGFDLAPAQLFTPGIAAARWLRQRGLRRIHLAAAPALAEDLGDVRLVDPAPDAVLLGDLHLGFDWPRLNALFQMLRQGAELVALHKNRYCRRGAEIALDLGPFVAALDYASGRPAAILGKPSALLFQLALDDLGLATRQVAMVGDDLEADIGGARQLGLVTIQVRTGKFTATDLDHPSIRPDHLLDSAALLPALLAGLDGG